MKTETHMKTETLKKRKLTDDQLNELYRQVQDWSVIMSRAAKRKDLKDVNFCFNKIRKNVKKIEWHGVAFAIFGDK